MSEIRAFIAIELPEAIHKALEELSRKLQLEIPSGVRWVATENQHLTLKFLGESAPGKLQLLSRSLPAALRTIVRCRRTESSRTVTSRFKETPRRSGGCLW